MLAAGNRAILKPSEIAPRTAAVLAAACAELLDPLVVGVVTGGPDIAAAVSAQPFDHLVFTGSTPVGKLVMRSAADNLVPVTLELGG
ncbi:Coniferyl aldehyde dehydrogenase [compost metagenome]